MWLNLFILVTSLFVLLKASDLFIDLASSLGKRLGLKEYFIGSLIVGIGTSLPELFTSLVAVAEGSPSLVAPTVYGTIIANLGAGFGLGVLILFVWVRTDKRWFLLTRKHAYAGGVLNISQSDSDNHFVVPVMIAAFSVVLSCIMCLDNTFSRTDASIFLACYACFMFWELRRRRRSDVNEPGEAEENESISATTPKWTHTVLILTAPFTIVVLFTVGGIIVSLDQLVSPVVLLQVLIFLSSMVVFFWMAGWGVYAVIGSLVFPTYLALIGGLFFLLAVWWLFSRNSDGRRPRFGDFWTRILQRGPKMITLGFLCAAIMLVYISGVATVKVLMQVAGDLEVGGPVLAATALAVGTSLPDIVVALNIARRGLHRMLTGHILQSNIFDVFLIMGLCGLATPLTDVFTGPARLSVLFSTLMTVPLLITIRTRRINVVAASGLFAGLLLFLALVIMAA